MPQRRGQRRREAALPGDPSLLRDSSFREDSARLVSRHRDAPMTVQSGGVRPTATERSLDPGSERTSVIE
jgi:hypothetical protein